MSVQMTGFDIGEQSLKMAVFSGDQLEKTICEDLPDNLIKEGKILSFDALAGFIKDTAKQNGVKQRNAAVILPSSSVYVRTVSVPMMTERQLSINLPYEFKDYLTEKEQYYFDYEVLETMNDEEGKPKGQKLFICASPKSVIDQYRSLFAKAGYNLKCAVPEEYVYAKLSRGDAGISSPAYQVFALVDFGHTSTRVNIIRDGQYDNKRVIELGISELDQIISEETETDIHVARNYKLTNFNNCLSSDRCIELYNRMGVEIMKAANFYNYNNRDVELRDLYLFGGGATIPALRAAISQVTGLTIHPIFELVDSTAAMIDPWLYLRSICVAANE